MSERKKEVGVEEFSMSLGDHIEELRRRVLRCILVVGAVFIAAWFLRGPMMRVLIRPHALAMKAFQLEPTLKFRTYLEPVTAQLKACLVLSLVLAAPVLLYQMWAFIAPGLYKRERRLMVRLGLVSALCFAAGVAFGYFLFIPLALRFLLALSGAQTEPVLMIGSYLSLLFVMTLALGVVFQTPLVMFHLVRWGIVSVEAIQEHRKMAILAGFVLAAFFTPPDPFTQIMMAVPLIMLYDLGALAAAPSRRAFANFGRFAGLVTLVLGAAAAFFFLWPVGRISAVRGTAQSGSRLLQADEGASLRRGRTWHLGDGGLVRIDFRPDAPEPHLLISGKARFQVHGCWKLSLYDGRALANNTAPASPMEVRTPVATVILRGSRTELIVRDPNTLTVNVLAGEVVVKAEGRTARLPGGHSRTFRRGGEAFDTREVDEKWRRLLSDENDNPPPLPDARSQPGP